MSRLSRRTLLKRGGGTLAGLLLARAGFAQTHDASITATPSLENVADLPRLEAALKEHLGIRLETLQASKLVRLKAPEMAESGLNVPVTLSVEMSPETVRAVHLFAERNPLPYIFKFTPGPLMRTVVLTAHIRMAETAAVRAVAELTDGRYLAAARVVRVSESGCG